jgi:hypothetical protein
MIELLILFFLVRRIVGYARQRGLSPLKWGILLVLNWFMFELLGIALATYLLGIKLDMEFINANPSYSFLLVVFGIGCGFLGYFVTRKRLDRMSVR